MRERDNPQCLKPRRWRSTLGIALLFIAWLASACVASAEQLNATAEAEKAATRISQLRQTATVARARLAITLDYAGTRVDQVADANAFLRANLVSLGTDSAFIDAQLRRVERQAASTPQSQAPQRQSVGEAIATAKQPSQA